MKYHAFISYSHRDKKWGDWLHKSLETYKVPKPLVGTTTPHGEIVPARIFPVFRDREELPTATSLRAAIQEALEQSRTLIVICSPRSAKSLWVNQEILNYKRLGRENRIFAIVVDGTPNGTDRGAPDEECFPPALRYKLGTDGELSPERTEPIAADAREHADGKPNAFLKLLAGVLNVNFDDLKRRDEAARRRQQRLALATLSGIIATMAILAAVALLQRNDAIAQREIALQERNKAEEKRQEAETALQRMVVVRKMSYEFFQTYRETLLSINRPIDSLVTVEAMMSRYAQELSNQIGIENLGWPEFKALVTVILAEASALDKSASFHQSHTTRWNAYNLLKEHGGRFAEERTEISIWKYEIAVDLAVIFSSEHVARWPEARDMGKLAAKDYADYVQSVEPQYLLRAGGLWRNAFARLTRVGIFSDSLTSIAESERALVRRALTEAKMPEKSARQQLERILREEVDWLIRCEMRPEAERLRNRIEQNELQLIPPSHPIAHQLEQWLTK